MSITILIVEDHKGVREALRDWLEETFPMSHVIEAASGEEVMELIQNEKPNLVLMDFKLPGMNGIEATRLIKHSLPSTQIVMLSIREEGVYNAYASAAGASAYITKRAMFTSLRPTLTALLANIQATDSLITDT